MNYARLTLVVALLFVSVSAHAATFGIAPSTTQVNVGDLVTARIVLNSQGVAINNGEAILRFPTNVLSVVSVSKASSLFSLWVEEPVFSNTAGTISYNGGVPNPGFTGSNGTVLTVTFTAKQAGTATLSFSDGAIRANDGNGTDVLSGTNGTQVTVIAVAPTAPPPVSVPSVPVTTDDTSSRDIVSDIIVSSPTHPDQEAWYANGAPTFRWKLPANAESVQLIVDRSATTQPSVTYKPAIVEKTVANLEDGTWYFRVRARVANAWTTVSSYRVNIDTEQPELSDTTFSYDVDAGVVVINATAHDAGSGIASYELRIDEGEVQVLSKDAFARGMYELRGVKPGRHIVTLSVFDQAGNTVEASGPVTVSASVLDTPILSYAGVTLTLFGLLLLMAGLSVVSLLIAAASLLRLFGLTHRAHPALTVVENEIHRGFSMYKKELVKNLRVLEQAREGRNLTPEETKLHKSMLQNLTDLERYISERVENAKDSA